MALSPTGLRADPPQKRRKYQLLLLFKEQDKQDPFRGQVQQVQLMGLEESLHLHEKG
jgi:hypothetical protein